jgi:hypothetical protein
MRMLLPRLSVLGLSAMLALTALLFTAPVTSAHSGHPNIIVQVDKWIHKAESWGDFMGARYMLKIQRGERHWRNQHGFSDLEDVQAGDKGTGRYPRFILRMGCATPEFDDWWAAARKVSKTGFRYYRGQAANYRWLDPIDRENRAFFNAKLFARATSLYEDASDDLFDCILDEDRGPRWLKRLLF